jgi:hypothetical protein
MKPSSEFPCLWLVDVLQCRTLIGCRENVQGDVNLSLAASGMILQNHRRLPVSIFSVKIPRVFEAGYWKDFQN